MSSPLWSFTLDFYALPGVEQACLALQASGANVCAVLCGIWLDQRGVPYDPQRAAQIGQLATPWQDQVVRPLRQLRIKWKNTAATDDLLTALRERVKALELEAEQALLQRLEQLVQDWPGSGAQNTDAWLQVLAGDAANERPDALQVLRVRAGLA